MTLIADETQVFSIETRLQLLSIFLVKILVTMRAELKNVYECHKYANVSIATEFINYFLNKSSDRARLK